MYLLAFSLPLFNAAIAVSYDFFGWWLWFGLIPLQMCLAFFLSPPRLKFRTWIALPAVLILVSIVAVTGFSSAAWSFVLGGLAAFATTSLVFKAGGRGRTIAAAEMFVLGLIYFKMLSFSRASEAIARESSGITQIILFASVGAFLLHGLVLYLSAFRMGIGRKSRRELALFFALAVPVGLFIALLMPADFVDHSIVFNRLKEPPKPQLTMLDDYADSLPGGNLRSNRDLGDEDGSNEGDDANSQGQQDGDDGRGGRQNSLEGYPGQNWGDEQMGEGGESKQYAVMVVASPVEPVYAADGYFQRFDAEQGFVFSKDEELNGLTYQRLLETWQNRDIAPDAKREVQDIFVLSTIPKRVLAYEPRSVAPTVLNRRYHPFSYSYTSSSAISATNERDWRRLRDLNEQEKAALTEFLQLPLAEENREAFTAYLARILGGEQSYYGRISAILQSFGTYQYEIGFDDDLSVAKMRRFLFETKTGDCTEFSNTTGILGRLAGIPTRIVTGYLASSGLQTLAHRRGIRVLRESIEQLQQFEERDLYLVTTAHRHSWVQFYLAGYGWVDFETTAYAIPPAGSGNPNSMDVVIPIIQETEPAPKFEIPWFVLLRLLMFVIAIAAAGLYLYRYVGELYLVILSRSQSRHALKALGRVLLLRLASEGYKVKDSSQTFLEYSEQHPEIAPFASLYTSLRYREPFPSDEWERAWAQLRESYSAALTGSRKKGLPAAFKRVFSLKGVAYL